MPVIQDAIQIRPPRASDGYEIHQLIASSPPLDLNSLYSYYLLSDHFGDSCVVAESQGRVVGFLSAYRIPQRPKTLFVWQVVVNRALRGQRIAWHMLEELLDRYPLHEVDRVEATVNPSNAASRALFERLAIVRGTTIEEESFLDASAFGPAGNHESEILLRIALSATNS
ncbi:MAG: diaminobutyrate acetyltransferase [Chromatiales bacterium]|nr:diaminobutyrate acetyltransferase [Chromatiales bacterium]